MVTNFKEAAMQRFQQQAIDMNKGISYTSWKTTGFKIVGPAAIGVGVQVAGTLLTGAATADAATLNRCPEWESRGASSEW
jgi:hypothetical protein